jgi:hypothetical protein
MNLLPFFFSKQISGLSPAAFKEASANEYNNPLTLKRGVQISLVLF